MADLSRRVRAGRQPLKLAIDGINLTAGCERGVSILSLWNCSIRPPLLPQ